MYGLRKAAAETRHYGYTMGLKTCIYYNSSTDTVHAETVTEGTEVELEGYIFCGVCRYRKSMGEIMKMVQVRMKMIEDNDLYYSPRLLPDDIMDMDLVAEHKSACENWLHGDMSESWVDDNGYICIRYADGAWYHYGRRNIDDSIVWW